jgi:hypothetical protein
VCAPVYYLNPGVRCGDDDELHVVAEPTAGDGIKLAHFVANQLLAVGTDSFAAPVSVSASASVSDRVRVASALVTSRNRNESGRGKSVARHRGVGHT